MEKFSYDSYLAISAFNLLSYVAGVDAQLGKHCDFLLSMLIRLALMGLVPVYVMRFRLNIQQLWYDPQILFLLLHSPHPTTHTLQQCPVFVLDESQNCSR